MKATIRIGVEILPTLAIIRKLVRRQLPLLLVY